MAISTDRQFRFSAMFIGLATLLYTSVYGDRWRVTSDRVVPERI
jgi:hypothetical protein